MHHSNPLSFLVGARAFDYLALHATPLLPAARGATEQAADRGALAGAYYFVESEDDVARDVRDCLRRGAVEGGAVARACDASASAIDHRRRAAWYARACPRCGGAIRPRSW